MASVDFRTRFQGDTVDLKPSTFLDEYLPPLLDAHCVKAGRGAATVLTEPNNTSA